MSNFSYSDELYHFGIKGQKWGIRRFQNEDGTRTEEGKRRYSENIDRAKQKLKSAEDEIQKAKNAKSAYKTAKDDPFAKASGELKRLKKEAKYYSKKSTIKKLDVNKRQAEWEIAKNQKKLDELNGVANNVKVSAISPKTAYYGKKVAKAILGTAIKAGVAAAAGAVGGPIAVGAAEAATNYANATRLESLVYSAAGIDSISEAAIEGGRAVVSSMLGITYATPTERAITNTVTNWAVNKKPFF